MKKCWAEMDKLVSQTHNARTKGVHIDIENKLKHDLLIIIMYKVI